MESCERIKGDTIRINFDTVKKDKKERIFTVEEGLCQVSCFLSFGFIALKTKVCEIPGQTCSWFWSRTMAKSGNATINK